MTIDKGLGYLIIIICVCWAYTQGGIFGSLGVGAVGFVVYDFITQKKVWLPIGELALLLGGLQWVISPFFSYMTDNNVYSMSQPCNEYMMYTVPCIYDRLLCIQTFVAAKQDRFDKML